MKISPQHLLPAVALLLCLTLGRASGSEASNLWSFAAQLVDAGDAANASVDFRRIAALESDVTLQGEAYWHSAYQYWILKQPDISDKMLNRSEDAASELAPQIALLRGENARLARNWDEAAFHFQSVLNSKPAPEMKIYAARRLATAEFRRGNTSGARDAILVEDGNASQATAALETFERHKDRSPMLGGILGLIPGLGYAYSGEYANATRSLLINALFGYGMYHTGKHDQWGAFSAISFFEITWYTGSIYGGVDAAHRYNQNRREAGDAALGGTAAFEPDWARLPLVHLNFSF